MNSYSVYYAECAIPLVVEAPDEATARDMAMEIYPANIKAVICNGPSQNGKAEL